MFALCITRFSHLPLHATQEMLNRTHAKYKDPKVPAGFHSCGVRSDRLQACTVKKKKFTNEDWSSLCIVSKFMARLFHTRQHGLFVCKRAR